MKMKKLTVGVPVYNAAPYLSRCLDSLLRQGMDLHSCEILCVDDGSTDSSWSILCEYKRLYPGVFSIFQNDRNQGLAYTRNKIIETASGEYLNFIDADDFVIDDALAFLFKFISEDVDVLQYSMMTLDNYVLKNNLAKTKCSGEIKFDGFGREFLERGLPTFIQVLIMRVEYLRKNNFYLLDTRYCEDPLFILRLYMANPRIRYINCDAYRYTENANQMSRERDPRRMQIAVQSYLTFFEYLVKYRDDPNNGENLQKSLCRVIDGQLLPFVSRTFCANLGYKQYLELKTTLKKMGALPTTGGLYASVINYSFGSYGVFFLFATFFKWVFVPFILPRMNRN